MKQKLLDVYLYETCIGHFEQDISGKLSFVYSKSWLDSNNSHQLSCSLPLRSEPFTHNECRGFFAGLLPESDNREVIAKIFGVSSKNDYALLKEIGGECAGAVSFTTHNKPITTVDTVSNTSLSTDELETIINDLPRRPLLAGTEGLRISLAGVQDKFAIQIKDNNKIFLPKNGEPSTHIIKPAIGSFENITHNEALCLELAHKIGINAAKANVMCVNTKEVLCVQRYDRTYLNNKLTRLHQEDFCQALALPPEFKYQSEGGPSLKQCFELVRKFSSAPAKDVQSLLNLVIFNVVIGNNDAHGKNFSFLYDRKNGATKIQLAPAYDLVSTIYYSELSNKMAMKIGKQYSSEKIDRLCIEKFSEDCELNYKATIKQFNSIASTILDKIDTLAEKYEVITNLIELIKQRANKIVEKTK